MNFTRPFALLLVALMGSCATAPTSSKLTVNAPSSRAWWQGDGVVGKPRLVINLSEQRIHYYKGSKLVGVSPISSGRESHATVNGRFSIIEKDLNHRSSVYGVYVNASDEVVNDDVDVRRDPRPPGTRFVGASMRYFMRIVGGIGMHEGYLPGFPASHGCIRVPTKMAAIFFRETPHGTPVEIIGKGALASYEEEIPIGSHEDEIASAAGRSDSAAKTKKAESIRRAVSPSGNPVSLRYKPKKAGATWYLE